MADTDALKVFRRKVNPAVASAALRRLRQHCEEQDFDFDFVVDQLATSGGDISDLVGREQVKPVGIEQFMDDDYFLGIGREVYPKVREAAIQLASGNYIEAILTGAIGIGKTTLAQIVGAYDLYCLSLYASPQLTFGLFPTSSIVVAMLNRTDSLAKKVTYGEFKSLIEGVPYFTEKFPFNHRIASHLSFPKHIRVEAGQADANRWLGMNVIGGTMDEANFMNIVEKSKRDRDGATFDQAEQTYNAMVTRRMSRFNKKGKLPGVFCVVSSKGHPDDFTERRVRDLQSEKLGHLTYIYDHAQWEILPEDKFSSETFRIEIGDERRNSRVLEENDEVFVDPHSGKEAELIHVPIDYYDRFKSDMNRSLRDLAGRTTMAKTPFFYSKDAVYRMPSIMSQITPHEWFRDEQWCLKDGQPEIILPEGGVPNPDMPRAMHIDLGLTSDAAGVAIGHVSKVVLDHVMTEAAERELKEMPMIAIDASIRITPPADGEIDFSELRELIYRLSRAGLPIRWITLDGFQSVDMRQILRKKGYKTGYLSVEKVEPYRNFRDAVIAGRVASPVNAFAFSEMLQLEKTEDGKKIDHPSTGSKDVADAYCGVYNLLMKQRKSWSHLTPERLIKSRRDEEVADMPAAIPTPPKEKPKIVNPRAMDDEETPLRVIPPT